MLSKLKKFINFAPLLICDVVSFYISITIGFLIRKSIDGFYFFPEFTLSYFDLLSKIWILIFLLFFLFYERAYEFIASEYVELKRILKANLATFFSIFIFIGFTKNVHEVSRFLLAVSFVINPILSYFLRQITKNFLKKYISIALISPENESIFSKYKKLLYKFGYKIDYYPISQLSSVIEKHNIVLIYLKSVEDISLNTKLLPYIVNLRNKGKEVYIISKNFSFMNSKEISHFPLADVFISSIDSGLLWSLNKLIKNLIDYLIALILFPFFLVLLIIIAILIKMDSPGPVFYKQKRVGLNGKEFYIYKFRTMYVDADERLEKLLSENKKLKEEWIRYRKLRNDPRITKVGKFLRKTSLDELPQIINVLKGEMSVVGPRPLTKEEIEKYYGDFKDILLSVKPGITGYWQVSGRNKLSYEQRIKADLFYILNWNIFFDVYILLKTVYVILKGTGAY